MLPANRTSSSSNFPVEFDVSSVSPVTAVLFLVYVETGWIFLGDSLRDSFGWKFGVSEVVGGCRRLLEVGGGCEEAEFIKAAEVETINRSNLKPIGCHLFLWRIKNVFTSPPPPFSNIYYFISCPAFAIRCNSLNMISISLNIEVIWNSFTFPFSLGSLFVGTIPEEENEEKRIKRRRRVKKIRKRV